MSQIGTLYKNLILKKKKSVIFISNSNNMQIYQRQKLNQVKPTINRKFKGYKIIHWLHSLYKKLTKKQKKLERTKRIIRKVTFDFSNCSPEQVERACNPIRISMRAKESKRFSYEELDELSNKKTNKILREICAELGLPLVQI